MSMAKYYLLKCGRSTFLYFIFFFFNITVFAQSNSEFLKLQKQYPDSQVLKLINETVVTLSINNGNIDITQEILEENLYMDESATRGSKRSLNYSSFFEMGKIEASTFIPQGNKYKEQKVTSFIEKDEMGDSFYDDTRSVNFIYPGLQKGGKTRLNYSQKINNPRFLTPFYLGDFYPVVNNKLTIIAHKDINFSFRQFNTEGLDIKYTESQKQNNRIYTWEVKNVKEYKPEGNAPTYKKVIPHIIPVITDYKFNGSTLNVLNGVEDLFNWYNTLIRDLNNDEPTPQLVDLVQNLTNGKETELEKVKAIYYWTQQNIKYIAFEYALGGFIPREANSVFQKKYGDCKDNSSILLQMLQIAGIKGNLTWLGTREIPYTYEEVPTPLVDNHMILAYLAGEQIYYLDATGRHLPIDLPSSFIQGKEALIAMDNGKFRIETVPVVPSEKNSVSETSFIRLDGTNVLGNSSAEISGYPKVETLNYLEDIKTGDKQKEFYKALFEKGNNRFLIEELSEINKYDYEKNFIVNYNFNITNYAKNVGDEIFLNLNLNRILTKFKTPEDRKNEVEYEYKNQYHFTNSLEIPEGYEVKYLPKDQDVKNHFISSSISYKVKDNIITYNHFINLDFIILDRQAQKEVNALIREVEQAYKEIIVLKKN